MERTDPTPDIRRPASPVVTALKAQIDERDEIIRLLNEALSRALDELTLDDRAA